MVRALGLVVRRLGLPTGSAGALRPSIWLLLSAFVGRTSGLVAIALLSRTLAPAELGMLTLVQAAGLIAVAVAGLGLPLAVTRQVAHVRDDAAAAGRHLGGAVLATVLAATIAVVAVSAARGWVAATALGDRALTPLLPAAVVGVAGLAIATVAQAGMSGLESFRRIAVAQSVQGVLASAGLVIGAVANGAQSALVGFAAGQILAAVLGLALLHRDMVELAIPVRAMPRRVEARAMAAFAASAILASLTLSAALLGGQLLLRAQAHGYARIAEFAVAYRWHLAIAFVPSALVPAVVPILTRQRQHDGGQARDTLWLTLVSGTALAILPAIVIAAAAPLVLGLSGSYYAAHPWTLVVLALAAVPVVLNNILSSAAISYGALRAWVMSDLALAVGLVALAVVLVPKLQTTGLAVAYLGGYLLTNLVLAPEMSRRSRTSASEVG